MEIQEKIKEAILEARKMAQPIILGLRDEDIKEIKAFQSGIDWVERFLKYKGILKN